MVRYKSNRVLRKKHDSHPESSGSRFLVKSLSGILISLFVAGIYVLLSYCLFFPKPQIRVSKPSGSSEPSVYHVMISNESLMEIYNMEFAISLDQRYPVRDTHINEVRHKSGLRLLDDGGWTTKAVAKDDIKSYPSCIKLVSGIVGSIDKFSPGTIVAIDVVVDTTYEGTMGDVFPTGVKPRLRNHSYYVEYKYRPLGPLAPIHLPKNGCFDFQGNETIADNCRKYEQKVTLPDGQTKVLGMEVMILTEESEKEEVQFWPLIPLRDNR